MSEYENLRVVFLEGDGVGHEITPVAMQVLDAALRGAYAGQKSLSWEKRLAGKEAAQALGTPLPKETVEAIRHTGLALKGPVETPVGKGIRSVNVALRKTLDLFACVRPVRYFEGVVAPVKRPMDVDVVIFRENTEDVYAGIEWREGTPEAKRVIDFLREMGHELPPDSGIGIKPMSERGSKRLIKSAIEFAIDNKRESVTLVHKGNIMKFTEGAFRDWGYEVAAEEFPEKTTSEHELANRNLPTDDLGGHAPPGTVIMKDRIADAMFQELILRPERYSVLALSNLNGDYVSDAAAAQVGGLGIAPGANIGDEVAVFEATHGTAPDIAGQGKANPCSLILSGVLMFRHLGWIEAADRLEAGVARLIKEGFVTIDLATGREDARVLSTSEFGKSLISEVS